MTRFLSYQRNACRVSADDPPKLTGEAVSKKRGDELVKGISPSGRDKASTTVRRTLGKPRLAQAGADRSPAEMGGCRQRPAPPLYPPIARAERRPMLRPLRLPRRGAPADPGRPRRSASRAATASHRRPDRLR